LPSGSPPEFFIDRSLGRHIVPDALRAAGATVHTMADVYGERISQGLSDEEWLREAGERGWVVLMKDAKVRHRPAQRLAIEAYAVRAFVVTNANLTGADQAERLVSNLNRIAKFAQHPGPYICGVYSDSVKLLWPTP